MKKNIWKYALLLIGMLIAVPTVINAKDDKKAKKEKKQFEWTWDKKLSGNETWTVTCSQLTASGIRCRISVH